MANLNYKRGFRRIILVLSLVIATVGFFVFASESYDFDSEDAIEAMLFSIFLFVIVWTSYFSICFVIAFVVRGFQQIQCANCERIIKKPKEVRLYKDHSVCPGCHEKLSNS